MKGENSKQSTAITNQQMGEQKVPKQIDKLLKNLNLESNESSSQRTPGKSINKQPPSDKFRIQQQQLQLVDPSTQQPNEIVDRFEGTIQSARIQNQTQRFGAFQNQTFQQIRFQHKNASKEQKQQQNTSHSHHQSLSETRSLKSFRSLQDERLQRKLFRKLDSSTSNALGQIEEGTGGNESKTRQLSNVREMIQSEEEAKQFETKFKGSLQKLDQFEKEWNDFKYNMGSTNQGQSNTVNSSQQEIDFRGENNRIHQSFDAGSSTMHRLVRQQFQSSGNVTQTSQQQDEYNSLSKKERVKGPQQQANELRSNKLDQIIESPRESILQSPSTAKNNQKVASLTQQQKSQPPVSHQSNISAFASVNKSQQPSSQNNNQCKTLQIDLNEELFNIANSNSTKPAPVKLQQAKSQDNTKSSGSQHTKTKKTITGGFQGSVGVSIKSMENVTNSSRMRQRSSSHHSKGRVEQVSLPTYSQANVGQNQKKDDLVERVMESIKVLNKKEEEMKQSKQSNNTGAVKKPVVPQVSSQSDSLVNAAQIRRRTNTLTVEERPTLMSLGINQNKMQLAGKETSLPQAQPSVRNSQQSLELGFQQKSSFVKTEISVQQSSLNNLKAPTTRQEAKLTKSPTPVDNSVTSSKGQLSQQSKDKVEQLRKAFSNNKDNQVSKSTKNLQNSQNNSQSSQSNLPSAKASHQHNFKLQTANQNIQQMQAPNSINNKPVTLPQQSSQSKITKRTDINLIQDEPSNKQNVPQVLNSSQSPSKTLIQKKNSTTTPQQKLQASASPSQVTTSQASFSSQSQAVSGISVQKVGSNAHVNHKNKNRRQPTQTSIDCTIVTAKETAPLTSSTNVVRSPKETLKQSNEQKQQLIERVEGEKLLSSTTVLNKNNAKPKTLMNNYTSASPDTNLVKKESNPQSKNQSNQSISMLKKNKSDNQGKQMAHHNISQEDLAEQLRIDNEFLKEQQKKLNFQPIQEPSFNWNASPDKPLEKLRQKPQEQTIIEMPPMQSSQRNSGNPSDFQIKLGIVPKITEENNFIEQQIMFPSVVQKQQQQQVRVVKQQLDTSDDDIEDEHRIENKLNDLLEETRRKLLQNDDEDQNSSISESDLGKNQPNDSGAFMQIQAMQNMRTKSKTPSLNMYSQPQYPSQPLINAQPQIQIPIPHQQPPFIYDQQQNYPYMYPPQPVYPGYMYAPPPYYYQQQPMGAPPQQMPVVYPNQMMPQNYMPGQQNPQMIIGVDSKFYFPKTQVPEHSSFLDEQSPQFQSQKFQSLQDQQQFIMIPPPIQQQSYKGRQSMDNSLQSQNQIPTISQSQNVPLMSQYDSRAQAEIQQQNQYQFRMGAQYDSGAAFNQK